MTGDEAKTKWCPFARVVAGHKHDKGTEVSGGQPSFNRVERWGEGATFIPGGSLCIASACMAWRWESSYATNNQTDRGYCGLAGKP